MDSKNRSQFGDIKSDVVTNSSESDLINSIINKSSNKEQKQSTAKVYKSTKNQLEEIVGNMKDRSIIKELDNAVVLYKNVYDKTGLDTDELLPLVKKALNQYDK